MTAIKYRTADVGGFNLFYREAGAPDTPKLLLLHGFPSASHMFRDLIPLLVDRFHMIAPDLPGLRASPTCRLGASSATPSTRSPETIDRFTEVVGFDRYRGLCFRLRRADRIPARHEASGAHHGNHLAERQCL